MLGKMTIIHQALKNSLEWNFKGNQAPYYVL